MCYQMRIPKGGAYLPAIRPRYLEERIDTLGSCKEREMLLAAYHRRRGMAITDISVEMRRPREVIRYYFSSLPTLLFRPVSVRLPVLPATTVFDLPIRTRRR